MKTADQAIHDVLWTMLSAMVDGKIFESRPMYEVGYPFVDFEDMQTSYYTVTKHGNLSRVDVSLNIWDTEDNRKNVSDICENVIKEMAVLHTAYEKRVSLRVSSSGTEITQDRTVNPPVWRGRIHLVFDIL